jgi:hypothetical protein
VRDDRGSASAELGARDAAQTPVPYSKV